MRGLRSCLTLVGLLVVVGAGILAFNAVTSVKTAAPLALVPSPGTPQQPATSQPAAALDARLASAEGQIRQNAAAGRHTPVSFTVTDPELTARVNQAITSGQVQV